MYNSGLISEINAIDIEYDSEDVTFTGDVGKVKTTQFSQFNVVERSERLR